jgi:hypothetical protein
LLPAPTSSRTAGGGEAGTVRLANSSSRAASTSAFQSQPRVAVVRGHLDEADRPGEAGRQHAARDVRIVGRVLGPPIRRPVGQVLGPVVAGRRIVLTTE